MLSIHPRRAQMRYRRRIANETGAIAVVVAVCSIMLMLVSALAIDLGNGFARKRSVHNQADFSALAGGAALPGPGTTPTASDPAIQQAAEYMEKNEPQNDAHIYYSTSQLATMLTDADPSNGQAYYGHFSSSGALVASSTELTVVTPPALVEFGLARVIGINSTRVRAAATVGVYTPGGVMPFFAVQGCDYGLQTIADPAAGGATPAVPTLAYSSDSNEATLTGITTNPATIAVGETGAKATLSFDHLTNTTMVGFFPEDDTSDTAIITQPNFGKTTPYTKNNGTITFDIPTSVTSEEKVWYVRVFDAGSTNKWSAEAQAQPLRIGQAVLECSSAASDGNFGTLTLPRNTPAPNDSWLPVNMAVGLEPPLTVSIHQTPSGDGLCTDGVNGAVESTSGHLKPGTNCVDTDTGLTANDATQGLITGYHHGAFNYPGRLIATTNTQVGGDSCGPPSNPTTLGSVTIGSTAYTYNNDVLTCFLTDGKSLYDITRPGYSGGPALAPEIYSSPRFFWQPVLKVDPDNGGSHRYSVIDYRPAFLTDETATGSAIKGSATGTSDNGLIFHAGQIVQMKVVFFNADALPADGSGSVQTPYIGAGPRIIRLTN